MTDTKARASTWSVTINNPTSADEEAMQIARQKGWKVEGQLEKGAEGTEHYQLMVKTPQVRFAAVKKAFPRAHIEIARNPQALGEYVHKEQSRAGELLEQSDKYPSLAKFWDLIYDELAAILSDAPDDSQRLFKATHDQKMEWFDMCCMELISNGFHVETMAVNPQMRSCFSKFASALMMRSFTVRQTVSQHVETVSNIVVPTVV